MPDNKPRDPHRFAGKVGIESGPVPLQRWKPSVAVHGTAKPGVPQAKRPERHRKGGD